MAATQNSYTGNGSTTNYSFTFPYLKTADVKCSIDATETTAFTLANATTIQFNSAPATGTKIKIFRKTDDADLTATFYAGSAIKSSDLNDNFTQNLYTTQEVNARYLSNLGGNMVGDLAMGEDADITFEGATDNTNETRLTVADPTADRTITLPDVSGTVVTTGDTGTVATGMIAADAITSAKIADDQINSEHYVDGSIDTAHIADSQVTTAKIANSNVTTDKIANDAVTSAKIADDQINSEHYVDGSIDTAHIADSQITSAKIVDGTIVAGDLASNSVTTAKITDANVTTAKIAADAITGAKIADDEINSEHYVAGSIDTEHIADSQITTAKIADNAINSAKIADDAVGSTELADGVIDTVHIGSVQVTDAKLASNSVTTAKITDANVTTDKIANDAITIGKLGCEQTTISDSDSHIPTSGAVVDYVAAQIAPLGGLEVIATEVAFPNTQPSAGVVISISDAGGVVVNGSGVSTTGRTVGGSTVTINGFPASLQSKTMAADIGLMVSSTGSSQTYTYHKILAKEADVEQLSNDINDFAARYRVGSTNPTSDLDAGDLFFNTSTQKLLVYNATNSAWEEAQSVGNFFISTFSEAFDGSRTQFTLSNAPTNVQQVILSLNGVIQKPGTAFTLSGSTVTLASAPASGTEYFAVVMGSTVNIGQPSNNTVTTAILQDDSVTSAKIAASNVTSTELGANAVITSKIADDAVTATKIGTLLGDVDFNDSAKARFGTGNDLQIYHDGSNSYLEDAGTGALLIKSNTLFLTGTNSANDLASFVEGGAVSLFHNDSKKFETTSAGVTTTGNTSTTGAFISTQTGGGVLSDNLSLVDNKKVKLGASDDLQIYHDGTDSLITNSTGDLEIRGAGTGVGNVLLRPKTGENGVIVKPDNAVELYYNNSKKFETTSSGVTVAGNVVATGNMQINDGNFLNVGNSGDLQIYHDGGGSYIANSTGILRLQAKSGENSISLNPDGAVELYYDNVKRFETTAAGASVNGVFYIGPPAGADKDLVINKEGTGTLVRFRTTGTTRGTITSNGSTVAYNTSASDRSMKKNFENWTENTLNLFKNINPQKFNFLDQEDGTDKEKGFIAQDMVASFPEAYQKNDDDKYMFNASGMVVYLMKAIQELETKVAALEAA